MYRNEYIAELNDLKNDLDKWDYDTKLGRHTCHVGELTITVDKGRDGAHWKVEHDRCVLPDDAKGIDQVVTYAKRAALDWAKAWVEQHVEPAVHA